MGQRQWEAMGNNVRQCRTTQGKKGAKGLLPASHQEGPHSFGLRAGDLGDTVDGVDNCRRPAQLSVDYWEEPGEVSCGLLCGFFFFPSERQYF